MLIRFTVKNYLSYRDEATLNMVKSRERQLNDHICTDVSGGYKTLRGAVIYGANASGKTNLVIAMETAQKFIVEGIHISQRKAFRLSSKSGIEPSSFDFEFKSKGKAYSYGFEVLNGEVVKEWLFFISFKKPDGLIFHRSYIDDNVSIKFGKSHQGISVRSRIRLKALISTTPKNTLILTDINNRDLKEMIGDQATELLSIPFGWFTQELRITRTGAKPHPGMLERKVKDNKEFRDQIDRVLKASDVGDARIELKKYEGELKNIITEDSVIKVLNELDDGEVIFVQFERRRFIVSKTDGDLVVDRVVVVRKDENDEDLLFELNEESEGTRRIIDLVPLFLDEADEGVIIIDELDRSLHPVITRLFHDLHFNSEKLHNKQLIIATHEHHLLSQDFYRRDEIWFVEKDKTGNSRLYSLADYDGLRFDKDIRKDYLIGRYGAVPNVGNVN